MKLRVAIYTIISLLLVWASYAHAWTGRVVGVSDGDTITVLHNNYPERVRLYGIDCPEKRQVFGMRARQFTADQVFGKE